MFWEEKISDVQRHLREEGCDGWLLYDFHGINPLSVAFLTFPLDVFITRRFFYWIPVQGEPVKIVHAIETHVLDHLPGSKLVYLKWEEFEQRLSAVLTRARKVAMEFSPHGSLPYVSKVDAGVVDLVRSFSVDVVSSANFLQYYTCVLDEEQQQLQLTAAQFLSMTADKTWEMIADSLKKGVEIDEYKVSEFIHNQIASHGFINEGRPQCAVNENSANPHYSPTASASRKIKRGDLILIDLWCKKDHRKAVYGDISRVAFAGSAIPDRHKEIFTIVRQAQKSASDFVMARYVKRHYPAGCEVDAVCRAVIEEAGYGAYFTHRTGHNIYTHTHGPGAHLDSLETRDFRKLIPRTCFSVEPGIYLPDEFGIRLEYDMIAVSEDTVHITGGIQEELVTLW